MSLAASRQVQVWKVSRVHAAHARCDVCAPGAARAPAPAQARAWAPWALGALARGAYSLVGAQARAAAPA